MHRIAILLGIFCTLINAIQIPNVQSFLAAIPLLDYTIGNTTQHELAKRQTTGCPTSYNNCGNLGQPGLCCAATAVCSADALGRVACCRSGVACSGTIGGIITGGTVDGNGNLVGVAATTTALSASTGGGYGATTTTTNGFGAATTAVTTTTAAAGATTATGFATGGNGGFIIASNSVVAQPGAAGRVKMVSRLLHVVDPTDINSHYSRISLSGRSICWRSGDGIAMIEMTSTIKRSRLYIRGQVSHQAYYTQSCTGSYRVNC